jgi:putative transposase
MRTERILVKPANYNYNAIKVACRRAKSVRNSANYIIRQSFFSEDQKTKKHGDADKELKREAGVYKILPSAGSQRVIQVLGADWKGYFEALKAFKKDPSKFETKPRPPKYKQGSSTFVMGRNGFKVVDGYVHMAKQLGIKPFKIMCCRNQAINSKAGDATIVQDIRFVPTGKAYFIEIVHKRKEKPTYNLNKKNVLGIDLGINNLATIVSNQQGIRPVLINGKIIKSVNAKYNKDCASLRSHGKGAHLKSKSIKRFDWINNYLHNASRFIINHAINTNSGVIVIGHNTGWKKESNIGKVNNQKFVSIPHSKLIAKIEYKAQEVGIKVIVREESYTSKASALDLDNIPNYGDKSEKVFSGRRVKRGMYKTKSGRLINADVNGGLNILRKEIGDYFIQKIADKGCVNHPMTINPLSLEYCLRTVEAPAIAA